MPENSHFLIKGLREGILVTVTNTNIEQTMIALFSHIKAQNPFFAGGKMILDLGEIELKVKVLSKIRDDLSEEQITLTSIYSKNLTTQRSGELLGLFVNPKKENPKNLGKISHPDAPLWHTKTVRSGTKLEHVGNILIIGDVNPGGEVIATGSIVVWGKVKGFIHAGKNGDESAFICALELQPTQLRIANEVATSPTKNGKMFPEKISIVDGQLFAEPWDE